MAAETKTCPRCGCTMALEKANHRSWPILVIAVLGFSFGLLVALVLAWTIIGLIVGLLLMAVSYQVLGQRSPAWRCAHCDTLIAAAPAKPA